MKNKTQLADQRACKSIADLNFSSFLRVFLLVFIYLIINRAPLIAQDGAAIFNKTCVTCHTVGGGKLVGPDLANVHLRRETGWLVSFIQSSQTMIQNGDPTAQQVFEEFNQMMMPDQPYSREEVLAVIDYIKQNSPDPENSSGQNGETTQKPEKRTEENRPVTAEDIKDGLAMFEGRQRLENKGPSCISCHTVKNDRLIGGGKLAKDLTTAYTRLGDAGIAPVLQNPPFPVMKAAYKAHSLTEDEVFKLKAFLRHADDEHLYQHPKNYDKKFLYAGLGGLLFILLCIPFIWFKRKGGSVNDKIYKRQIKSE